MTCSNSMAGAGMDRLNVSRTGIARVARSTERKIARNKAAHFSALLRGGLGVASKPLDNARGECMSRQAFSSAQGACAGWRFSMHTWRFPALACGIAAHHHENRTACKSRGRGEAIMASYKKILLCYDGSREGRKALRCGADLALDLQAETHLLSVVDMRSTIAQSAGLLTDVACGRFEETAREILQEGVDWLTERGVRA